MTSVTPEPLALAVAPSRRGWRLAAYAAVLLLVAAGAAWVSTHPDELATTDVTVSASTPVATPVFLGVYAVPAGSDRELHVSGVRVFATSSTAVTITPHVCRGGSVNVTTTPETFCTSVGPTEGATLRSGDAILLEVVGDAPGAVDIDRVRIAYRDGLQWATQDAGSRSRVVVLAR